MSSTSSNGILGEGLKTSALILVLWEYFAGPGWKERPRLPLFWRLPDAKHWACWHFVISISSIHTLIWNSSFCQPFRQGSKLVNWEKSTLGWWNGARTWGRREISHRAATKSACVSDQTNYFILAKKCGPESQSTQAILKQIGHKSYIHLEFHFCTFLRPPRSYI